MERNLEKYINEASGFQVDSRKIQPGELFFALPGKRVNGIDYLEQVAKRGAIAAVVPKEYRGNSWGMELVSSVDVKGSLQALAKGSLKNEKIIGVTGSVGKTTTKEFIWELVKDSVDAWRSPGNCNSQIGLSLSLLNRDRTKNVLILEYGISEKGDMDNLLAIVRPFLGVITKICGVHLEGLGDITGVLKEKQKLILASQKGIFPSGLELQGKTVGNGGDYSLEENRGIFISERGKKMRISPPFKESHFLQNLLTAFAVARELGVESRILAQRCEFLKLSSMRFEKVRKKGMLIIKDMYNASEESMKTALENLPKCKGRKIGVLGQMAELGKFSNQMHRTVGEFASDKLDLLLVLGQGAVEIAKGFEKSKKPCFHFENKKDLNKKLTELLQPNDLILIKGSRFLQMETIFEEVFDKT